MYNERVNSTQEFTLSFFTMYIRSYATTNTSRIRIRAGQFLEP